MVAILLKLWRQYRVAVGTSLVAFVATLLAGSWGDRTAFALHLAAVLVSACFGGGRAGAAATVLCTVALDAQYRLVLGAGAARHDPDYLTSLMLFVGLGLLVSYLAYECADAVRAAGGFHETLEGLSEAVVVSDSRGRVAFLNRAARSLTGWLNFDGVGQPVESVFAPAEDEQRERLRQFLARPRGALVPATMRLRHRDGSERAVEFWAQAPHDGGAAIIFFRGLQNKESGDGERAATLAAAAPLGLVLLDRDGRCVYSNPAYREAFGFSLEDGFEGCRAVHPEDRQAVAEWKAAALKGEACARAFRLWDEGGGAVRWVRLRSAAVRADSGEAVACAGVLEDITESKTMEGELTERRGQAEALKTTHEELQQRASALQQQLAERQRVEEALRRGHAEEQSAWEEEAEDLRQRAEAARKESAALAQRLAAADRQLAQLKAQEPALKQRTAERQKREEELRRQLAAAQQESGSLRQQFEQWQQREGGVMRELEEVRQKEAALRQQAAALEQQLAAARAAEAALRRELESERQKAETLAAEGGRRAGWLSRTLEGVSAGVVAWQEGAAAPWLNPSARAWLGGGPAALPGAGVQVLRPEDRSPFADGESPLERAARREPFAATEILVMEEGSGHRYLSASGAPVVDQDNKPLGYVLTLQDVTEPRHAAGKQRDLYQTARRRAEEERAELARAADEERSQWQGRLVVADEACGRSAFLAEVGRALAASLDVDVTLEAVAGLAVPRLGAVCAVRRVAADGALRTVAAACGDGRGAMQTWGDAEDFAAHAPESLPADAALEAGRASPVDEAQADMTRALAAAGMPHVDAAAAVSVPLSAGGHPVASLLFARTVEYSDSDMSLMEEFAGRAALALTAALRHREACGGRDRLGRRLTFLRGVLGSAGEGVCAVDRDERIVYLNPAAEALLGRPEAELFGKKLDEVLPLPNATPGSLLHALVGGPLHVEAAAAGRTLDCTVSLLTEKDICKGAVVSLRDAAERRRAAVVGGAGWLERVAARLRPEVDGLNVSKTRNGHVRRLAALADGLETVARLGSGELHLRPRSVDLAEITERAAALCEPLLRARGQHLTVALPLRPEAFEADGALAAQALAHLVENASRYSPPGGKIQLTAERRGGAVVLSVRDEGSGIAAKDLPRLQALCARSRRFWDSGDGLGMGVALARSLAELHGGRLEVRSDGPGRGSEFTLYLPGQDCTATACGLALQR